MLDDLDDSALDKLPYGVICLSERMTVLRMNRAESEASGIQRWRAIGRDFFGDVAPGPTNRALADAVAAFAADGATKTQLVHTFKRRAGADKTCIELERGRVPGHVYLRIYHEAA
ncbi:MAG: PAS domain-containing protein [Kofleriaceae bacterium]|nr:PAS domain-containing protein [Kofleriaceae bacterium]